MKNNPANMRGVEIDMMKYNKGGEKIMHISEISRISLVPGGDKKSRGCREGVKIFLFIVRGAENFCLISEGGRKN